tara:strand:+ start:456 stop:920 length:465 start_codon:yes stop_codon:yes gene_type:complete
MTSFKSKSNEPYEEFLAAIKLVSGEEILSKVVICNDDHEKVILENPVVCHEVRTPGANIPLGYKFEPWMKLTDEEVFIVDLQRIITISEINDKEVTKTYDNIIKTGFTRSHPELTKEMGYAGSVEKTRQVLEGLYLQNSDPKNTPKKPEDNKDT